MKNKNLFLIMFSALFTGFFVVSNFIAIKEMQVFGFLVSASAIIYPLTFAISNIVNEKYDIKEARKIILSGFVTMALVAALVSVTYYIPDSNTEIENAYKLMFESNALIVIASLITYLVSQLVNLVLYNGLSYSKYVKYFVSSLVAIFIDALIFKSILSYFGLINGSMFLYVSNQLIIGALLILISIPFFYIFTLEQEKNKK